MASLVHSVDVIFRKKWPVAVAFAFALLLVEISFLRNTGYYRDRLGWSVLDTYRNFYSWPDWVHVFGVIIAIVCLLTIPGEEPRQRASFALFGAFAGWFTWLYYALRYGEARFDYLSLSSKFALLIYFAVAVLAVLTLKFGPSGSAATPGTTSASAGAGSATATPSPWTDDNMIRDAMPIAWGIGLAALIFLPNLDLGGRWSHIGFWELLRDVRIHNVWTQVAAVVAGLVVIVLLVRLPAGRSNPAKWALLVGGVVGLFYPINLASTPLQVDSFSWGLWFFMLVCMSSIGIALVTLLQPE